MHLFPIKQNSRTCNTDKQAEHILLLLFNCPVPEPIYSSRGAHLEGKHLWILVLNIAQVISDFVCSLESKLLQKFTPICSCSSSQIAHMISNTAWMTVPVHFCVQIQSNKNSSDFSFEQRMTSESYQFW